MKKMVILAAFLLLVTGLATQAGAAKTVYLLDWIVFGKHAPFFAAQDKGFYKKVGLDVEYRRGFGSGRTITDLASKVGDIGFADAGSLVNARANNPGIKVMEVAMIHAKTIMMAFFLKEKGYKTPKDLVGVRIGSPVANANRVVFPAFAAANGFSADQVKWVDMPYGQVTPSMLTGRIDVGLWFATEMPVQQAAAAKIGKEIGFFSYGDWGVQIYNNGIIAREDTIESNPDFVRKVVKANMEAWAWSLIHLDEAIEGFRKHAPALSDPIVRGQLAITIDYLFDEGVKRHGLGYIDHQKMDNTIERLTKLQKLKRRVPTKDMYTNRFLPQWPAIKAVLGDKAM